MSAYIIEMKMNAATRTMKANWVRRKTQNNKTYYGVEDIKNNERVAHIKSNTNWT